jgi:hypothetical protein
MVEMELEALRSYGKYISNQEPSEQIACAPSYVDCQQQQLWL